MQSDEMAVRVESDFPRLGQRRARERETRRGLAGTFCYIARELTNRGEVSCNNKAAYIY